MAATTYRFSEFLDLLLVRLYEADRQTPDDFADLTALARTIKGDVPVSWVMDAGKVLETRAFADVLFTFGATYAKITGEGRLYVEEGRGTTKKIQEQPATYYVTVSGNNNQLVTGPIAGNISQASSLEEQRAPAFKLLKEAKERLRGDPALQGSTNVEANAYLDLVGLELKKPEPNRHIISAVLDPLSKIASIAGTIASLVKLFNAAA
jgi:hypothetical protein